MPIIELITFTGAYWIATLLYFLIVQKPAFGIWNRRINREKASISDILHVYRHGMRSDAIAASYITALPLVIAFVHTILPFFSISPILTLYNILISLTLGLTVASDTILYGYWQYKLDRSALVYLRSPKGAFASVSTSYILAALIVVILLAAIFLTCAQTVSTIIVPCSIMPWWQYILATITFAILGGIIFLIIRGTGIRANNPSMVYFSGNQFLNHWALNPLYSIIYSLSTKDEFKDQFQSLPPQQTEEIITQNFPTSGKTDNKILRTDRPNILLIVWESFGAEFTGVLGDKPHVTPNFDSLAKEGVVWSNCLAGSFRTDRGLVCLLSGIPGQPTTSVIRYTRKLPKLPALPRRLKELGYKTTAVHGGDLSIMHKNDYYLASGHDRLVGQKDMPKSAPAGKWGIDDGYMFQWLYDDIMEKSERGEQWFTTFQTLSSHEPFNVPYHRLQDKVDNSFAYTDHCLGEFITKLKTTNAWDNMIVAIVSDHGFNACHNPSDRASYAHIPLLLIGGAINHPQIIDTPISQTDFAATILGQMGLGHEKFMFSRDVTADTYKTPFSLHTFNNGFLISDPQGTTIYDNVAQKSTDGHDPGRELLGKAILQKLYGYLSDL